MEKLKLDSQDKIAETLLTTLNMRALDARQPDPVIGDKLAIQIVDQIDYDFSRLKLNPMDQVGTVLRVRQFDRLMRDFLARHPSSVVVSIGCGLDTRFQRVDNGLVEWYDLDLPDVIALRQKLVPPAERCHMLPDSVFDDRWLEIVRTHGDRNFFFLAEGVLVYFTEEMVRGLFQQLARLFSGCELACDGMTPGMIRMHNLELKFSKVQARLHWGLKNGKEPETWGSGIKLLSQWFYFDQPEPRLGVYQLMRYFPFLSHGVGIFHYQLGNPEEKNA